jgi:hypothetical protein
MRRVEMKGGGMVAGDETEVGRKRIGIHTTCVGGWVGGCGICAPLCVCVCVDVRVYVHMHR